MKFMVAVDRDEDGVWVVECPAIPGCVSQGPTKDEALVNIREAIELCLQVRAEQGLPLTVETRQIARQFPYNGADGRRSSALRDRRRDQGGDDRRAL
jgi:predicted RNase H-like HicB family nuclease